MSVKTRRVGREIQIQEVAPERRAVRGLGGGAGTDGQDLFGPVQLNASLFLSSFASVIAFAPWRMVEAELYTHAQQPTVKLGAGRSASARAEFLRITLGNGEGVVWADNVVRAPLPFGGQVAIGQVVTGQTLVSHDTCVVETRQGRPWESVHVTLLDARPVAELTELL